MKYFTIAELIYSNKARILGITNKPDIKTTSNLIEMVNNLLDPLRYYYGHPLIVTSGYRCPALNAAVGGVKTSAHQYGFAVDIVSRHHTPAVLFNIIKGYFIDNGVEFDQLILETSGNTQWVHIGYKNSQGKQRKQLKTLEV